MVGDIFSGITEALTGFIGTLNQGVQAIIPLFWTAPTGTGTSGELTILGSLVCIVVGVSLVYFLFRMIIGMARLRG